MYVQALAKACEKNLKLSDLTLSPSFYYDSLPQCIIDAVFSTGVKYTSTQNTVRNYCTYCGLREYNLARDPAGDAHTTSQLVERIASVGASKSADIIFQNRQRTSSRSGILKAEAVLRFAQVLQKYGIETLADFSKKGLPPAAEAEILQIPGQKSGLALRYFCMLAGDDTQTKPDRHVLHFMQMHTGQSFSIQQAQDLLAAVTARLKPQYPHITVRLLDHAIWADMSRGVRHQTACRYHKLVRDRIPEIIEASGRICICQTLSEGAYLQFLDEKLNEELAEYQQSKSLAELADLLEVMQAVVKARGWTLRQLEQARADKAVKRGGFDNRILLEEVWDG